MSRSIRSFATPSLATSLRTTLAAVVCVAALAACGAAPKSGEDVASLGTTTGTNSGGTGPSTDGSTPDTSTPDSVDPQQAFLDYTQCMRDEGIDLPDPQIASTGSGQSGQIVTVNTAGADEGAQGPLVDVDSEAYTAANEVCGPILDNARGDIEIDPELEAEQQKQMLAFAKCMRDQGIDFPDPVFSSNGGATMQIGGDATDNSVNRDNGPDSDKWQAAQKQCGDEMPGAIAIGSPAGG